MRTCIHYSKQLPSREHLERQPVNYLGTLSPVNHHCILHAVCSVLLSPERGNVWSLSLYQRKLGAVGLSLAHDTGLSPGSLQRKTWAALRFPSFFIPFFWHLQNNLIKQSIQSVFEDEYKVYHNVLLYMQYLRLELVSLNNSCGGGSSCFGGEMALAWESGDPGLSQIWPLLQ